MARACARARRRRRDLRTVPARVGHVAGGQAQNRCCIWRQSEATHVDHDHATGWVRGALFEPCNQGLGCFADDSERIRLAASYLRRCELLVAQSGLSDQCDEARGRGVNLKNAHGPLPALEAFIHDHWSLPSLQPERLRLPIAPAMPARNLDALTEQALRLCGIERGIAWLDLSPIDVLDHGVLPATERRRDAAPEGDAAA